MKPQKVIKFILTIIEVGMFALAIIGGILGWFS